MIEERPIFLENARQLHAAWAHELDVCLGRRMAVFEGTLLFGFAPEHFVIPVRVKRRVDINEVDARIGEFA